MTDIQLYITVGVPMLFNTFFFTALMTMMNRQLDQSKDLSRAELQRSEANADARLAELRSLTEKDCTEMLARFRELDARLRRMENELKYPAIVR